MTVPLIDKVVRHALATGQEPLADQTRAAVEMLTVDALGVAIAGSTSRQSAAALETALGWGAGDEASVWGVGTRLPAGQAALVNAQQLHCLEFDAIHEPAVVHPMTVVLPVLGAFVQREAGRGVTYDGEQFLRAVTAGVDVAAGLGVATTTALQFFRPATAGGMGAIAGLIALTQPPADRAAGAFGVVYGALSGTMQPHHEGAQVLALQVGFNARAALHAWDLAEHGFRGPREIIEGRYGYFRLIEAGGDTEAFIERLGNPHEVEVTSVKPFPSGRATHGILSALLRLMDERQLTMDEVASVEAVVPPMVKTLVGRPATAEQETGEARLSLAFLVPVLLDRGTIDHSAYSPATMTDPRYLEFAQRVTVRADDNPDPNAFDPQLLRVHLKSGETLEVRQEASLGSPSMPMSEELFAGKFALNLAAVGREAEAAELLAVLRELGRVKDVAEVLGRL